MDSEMPKEICSPRGIKVSQLRTLKCQRRFAETNELKDPDG